MKLTRLVPNLGSTREPNLFTVLGRLKSMVKLLNGDLFESKAQTLGNTVNCVGILGTGVPPDFKRRL